MKADPCEKRRQDRFQLARMGFGRQLQRRQALAAHVVHATPEHFVDEVFLAAEVVIDGRYVDVRAAGHLSEGGGREALLGEQLLRGVQDPVLGREMRQGHRSPRRIKRLFDPTATMARASIHACRKDV